MEKELIMQELLNTKAQYILSEMYYSLKELMASYGLEKCNIAREGNCFRLEYQFSNAKSIVLDIAMSYNIHEQSVGTLIELKRETLGQVGSICTRNSHSVHTELPKLKRELLTKVRDAINLFAPL